MHEPNPTGLRGIDFIQFVSPDPDSLDRLFLSLGFSRTMRHAERAVDLYEQNDIVFLLDRDAGSFGARFARAHGPSLCAMGLRFDQPTRAHAIAIERGARDATEDSDLRLGSRRVPAIRGIGDSLLHFVGATPDPSRWEHMGFVHLDEPVRVRDCGFVSIDHLTHNVERGTMERWVAFYTHVFGFTEVRHFDIRGERTGLVSRALRSPDGSFCIPINEAEEEKSQINEYLEAYGGPGVQHLAFLTADILESLRRLDGSGIETLDIDEGYYAAVWDRVPGVTEDRDELRRRNVLVDGDSEGYLLQIFTKNVVGPIFFEVIQRNNHFSFGEGNFGALFRSIERDQQRRGVFDDEPVPSTPGPTPTQSA